MNWPGRVKCCFTSYQKPSVFNGFRVFIVKCCIMFKKLFGVDEGVVKSPKYWNFYRNSIFNFFPNPAAIRANISTVGLLAPLSILLRFDCWMPVFSANSFCVILQARRASMTARITSYLSRIASYSTANSESLNCSFFYS